MEAHQYPLAMVLMVAHREMLGVLSNKPAFAQKTSIETRKARSDIQLR
jgi:hypothetical protein